MVSKEITFGSSCCFLRRQLCNSGNGDVPIYVNVNMEDGKMINTWVDSLSAAFAGVQVNSTA